LNINMFSPLEQFNVIFVYLIAISGFDWDFTIVNTILPIIFIVLFLSISGGFLYSNMSLIPSLIQYIFESIISFVFTIIKQQVGHNGYVYFPLLTTVFLFILISNYLSLLPLGIAITSHIIITICLSFSLCLSIFILGLMTKKIQFLRIFVPQSPLLLLPMLIVIELFSYALRSFSLAIRLSANILAGHTLVHIISLSVSYIVCLKLWWFVLGFTLLFPILFLEFCIAFLQAYVFCILLCIYLREVYSHGH